MWVKIDDECINFDVVTSVTFFRDDHFRGCTIYHGSKFTTVRVPLEPIAGSRTTEEHIKLLETITKLVN